MEVYIIEYDNLEPYEDGFNWVGEVFKTEYGAASFLESKGFSKVKNPFPGGISYAKELCQYEAKGAKILCKQVIEG